MEERIWHKAYAPGVPASIDYEDVTLHAGLERTVKNHPDTVSLIMMGNKITFREVGELVNRFAAAMETQGSSRTEIGFCGLRPARIGPNDCRCRATRCHREDFFA